VRVLRRRGDLVITETTHGFVCANAGVDLSNVERGWAALLPVDSDRSARRIRDGLRARAGVEVAVIVSDTFGRTWRRGLTDVAIGCAGIAAVVDLRGTTDAQGRELQRHRGGGGRRAGRRRRPGARQGHGIPVAVIRGSTGLAPARQRARRDRARPRRGPVPLTTSSPPGGAARGRSASQQ
jgi:coenzyme F420-0:L-glutamate ligase / coenzyme F420-1:gamma-L-glutamate ligase